MASTLRLSLGIFSVGFAGEAAGDAYLSLRALAPSSGSGFLLLLGPAFTVVGLIALWVGRHEWNRLHHQRVRHAHLSFGLAVLFSALAALPVGLKVALPGIALPGWVGWEFAAAVAATFTLTFVTYGVVAAHLTGAGGRAAIALATLWATGVAFAMGVTLASQLDQIVRAAATRSIDLNSIAGPISSEAAYLAVSYVLLFAAYLDAFIRVGKGLPQPPMPVPPPGLSPSGGANQG